MASIRTAFPFGSMCLVLLAGCHASPGAAATRTWHEGARAARNVDELTAGLQDTTSRALHADSHDQGVTAGRPFGFSSFGLGVFADTNDDGLPDTRLPAQSQDRMIVYEGAIAVDVPRAQDAVATFVAVATDAGGYVSKQQDAEVQVRVPAAKFDSVCAAVRGLGRVLTESRTANDVTKDYFDLGIRLETARKSRDRLLALLDKAVDVKDILAIEEQLRRLNEEIERFEGEQRFLADRAAMATLTARFFELAASAPGSGAGPSRFQWVNAVGVRAVLEGF